MISPLVSMVVAFITKKIKNIMIAHLLESNINKNISSKRLTVVVSPTSMLMMAQVSKVTLRKVIVTLIARSNWE